MKLLFTPQAEVDLTSILDFIARERPWTAKRVAERIITRCRQLIHFPNLGAVRHDLQGNYRSFTVQRWVVYYRVAGERIEIHRILDGARDVGPLLD